MRRLSRPLLTVLLVLALPLILFSTVFARGDLVLGQTENLYLSADDGLTVEDDVIGDVVAAGNRIVVKGDIGDNAILAGGAILVEGTIRGDALIAGGYVVINGRVLGDLRIGAGEVYINNDVGGDLVIGAGRYSIAEGVTVGGQEIFGAGAGFRGATDNPADLSAAKEFKAFALNLDDEDIGAVIGSIVGASFVVAFILKLVMFLGALIAGYVVLRMFPVFTESTLNTMKERSGQSILVGLLTYILAPLVGLFLLFSLVGVKLFLLLLLLGLLSLYLASVYANYYVGRWIMRKVFKKEKTGRALPLVVGYVVVDGGLFVIALVPLLGGLVVFVLTLLLSSWGLGAIAVNKYNGLRGKGKKSRK